MLDKPYYVRYNNTGVKKKDLQAFWFSDRKEITMSKNLEISVLLDYYGGMLTDKQRDVIDLYYNQDLSLAEIAEHEKISRQGVRDNIKRGEAYLTELEGNLHLAKQTVSLLALLEDIQRRNREIYRINEESKYSSEIKEHAVAIEDMLKTFLKEYE